MFIIQLPINTRKEYELKKFFLNLSLVVLLTVSARSAAPATITTPNGDSYYFAGGDEFEYNDPNTKQAVDPARWTHEVRSGYNAEDQFYTTNIGNSFVHAGVLNIVAKKESFGGKAYTSAFVTSKDQFCVMQNSFTTVRAKIPSGQGSWPAIWLLGPWNVPWPNTGEIDIMEAVGHTPNAIFNTIHTDTLPAGVGLGGRYDVKDLYSEFHTFSVYWNNSALVFLTDDVVTFTVSSSKIPDWGPFGRNRCFELILNNAVGGTWGGEKELTPQYSHPRFLLTTCVSTFQHRNPEILL